jgi:alanine racemase
MLYGVSPFGDSVASDEGLRPVMTLQSELIAVRRVRAGEAVGYGGSWRCPEDMPVGVVAMGYGDGYPRHAESGAPVLVNGKRAALIGKASMDMLTVDLRNQPEAKVGDPVVLWGEGLPVEEVARWAGTIPYELLCGVPVRARFVNRHEG